ncbi:hypothetical protein ALP80_200073 [Pseudomonas savastanoi pv. fraxini]|nr:hypothetical protein ALP80_200073 [Pseudomonas savastanoi pv. fraxini]
MRDLLSHDDLRKLLMSIGRYCHKCSDRHNACSTGLWRRPITCCKTLSLDHPAFVNAFKLQVRAANPV